VSTKKDLKSGWCCWAARKFGCYPTANIAFTKDGMVKVSIFEKALTPGFAFAVDRRLARLIAKRLNEALDDWAKSR